MCKDILFVYIKVIKIREDYKMTGMETVGVMTVCTLGGAVFGGALGAFALGMDPEEGKPIAKLTMSVGVALGIFAGALGVTTTNRSKQAIQETQSIAIEAKAEVQQEKLDTLIIGGKRFVLKPVETNNAEVTK
jgi:hypothetical protein